MRRALLVFLGLVLFTWLGFELFPGHTYLKGPTQLYLPMLERLENPGYLSRDLVATHPSVTYTVYDEITLFLRQGAGVNFRAALLSQQLLFRLAGLFGVFLIARACGLGEFWSFLVAAIASLGAVLPGPAATVIGPEPVPRAFAMGLTLLAIGCLAREKSLLAGLTGGIALLYDPRVAGPFWLMVVAAFIFDRRLRRLLRPCLPVLLVFVLLLANLAQLQPGSAEAQGLAARISDRVAMIQKFRTPYVWVSVWSPGEIWHYLAILVLGVWATARIWSRLNRQMRWIFIALPLLGILSIPVSYLLLEHLRWAAIPQIQPAKMLVLTVAFPASACALAGLTAIFKGRRFEAAAWFVVVFALPMQVRILDLLRFGNAVECERLGLALVLSACLVWAATALARTPWGAFIVLVPVAAMLLMPHVVHADKPLLGVDEREPALGELAAWAEQNTWAGSLFAFPDAARDPDPGIFRAESKRAIWVDWESGGQIDNYSSLAEEWWRRWQQTMRPSFTARELQDMLKLPIDYYVLKRSHALGTHSGGQFEGVPAVFSNDNFVVYDANDLRKASGELRLAPAGR
ncbi:MAG: hypothetical protein JOY54_15595 [Acidobacteriaceae bacterium]|nr:hypothetical protein [Acidobacteriaceae bacterium]